MAIVEPLSPTPDGHRRLRLRSTSDNQPFHEITVSTREDVEAALVRARAAQREWAKVPIAERASIVRGAIDRLVEHRAEIVETVRQDTGKTRAEVFMVEIISACDAINHWSSCAERDLSDEERKTHAFMRPFKKLMMHYRPLGVVGIITPWNGPFALAVNPSVQALLAGNAVLLKPSEVAPRSADWTARILHEAGVPKDVMQVLHGDGETGAALVNAGVQKISFTGSVATGKKIALACAEQLIPCTLELGGKDAMIVCEDADLERAANGAVFSSVFNTGHVCMGVERIYVVESVADEFERLVAEKIRQVRYAGSSSGELSEIGALFWDRQLPIIEAHVEDARKKGAEVVVGGEADTSGGLFYKPTFVRKVDHTMDIMRRETFGPIAAVMRVKDEDEAIRLANDSDYGLSGSVWTRDKAKGVAIAKQLETGSVQINDASTAYGVLEAPFGGMKDSGLGQVNGRGALRSYTFQQAIIIDRWAKKTEQHWYPHTEKTADELDQAVKYVYGTWMKKLWFMRK
jgi:acyl-CoA reductase-like NAD-dependent aldehyde dehydrogenase